MAKLKSRYVCQSCGSVSSRWQGQCPDCGDPIAFAVRDQRPDDESLLFHCLVPANRWWDDIGFT